MTPEEFRTKMIELPEPPADSRPPHWDFWRHDLWELITQGIDPRQFYKFPAVFHTMLVRHFRDVIKYEYDYLPISLRAACTAPDFLLTNDHYEDTKLSQNLIHQAYHLRLWQETIMRDFADITRIVEFGGGYGAMALVMRRLGFTGEYIILDSPEFSLLQQYFLSNVGVEATYYSDLDELMSNVDTTGLFIACFSLSEAPFDVREKVLSGIDAASYLFLYSKKFADYDNQAFFTEFAFANRSSYQRSLASLIPDCHYLITHDANKSL